MRSLRIPLFVSLILHGLLIWILSRYPRTETIFPKKRTFLLDQSRSSELPRKTGSIEPDKALSETRSPLPDAPESKQSTLSPESPVPLPAGWNELELEAQRHRAFVEQKPVTLPEKSPPWAEVGERPSPLPDDVAAWLRREQGIQVLGSTQPAENNVEGNHTPPCFDFIPTAEQLGALGFLFVHESATQLDLYRNLDSVSITAEGFDRSMEQLVHKGFVTRKKISPQNILTVGTPLGGIPVELSRKNRLNPVYQYRARVDKKTLIRYLQARIFQLKESQGKSRDTNLKKRIDDLELRLQLIIAAMDP